MTELGRRGAILFGTAATAVSLLIGAFNDTDILTMSITGLVSGFVFGIGGLLVGNLFSNYILNAAMREVRRLAAQNEAIKEQKLQEQMESATLENMDLPPME